MLKEMAFIQTKNNDGFVRNARSRFIGKMKSGRNIKKEFGLKDGSLKATLYVSYLYKIAIANQIFTEQ